MSTDIMLVNPLFLHEDPTESKLMTPYFPLGLLYLAATAREAGYKVSIFDSMFRSGDDEFRAALEQEKPTVVGISILVTVRAAGLRLARIAKEYGATVVVGGPDPTGRPASYLYDDEGRRQPVDVVVMSEGEHTLLHVLPILLESHGKGVDPRLGSVRGIAFVAEDGQVVTTPPAELSNDLDSIPMPARDMIDIEAYRRAWVSHHGYFSLSLIATRGCPYGCKWCQKAVFGRLFRARSPENVADEMLLIKQRYRPDQLRIVDDVMGINRRWTKRWRDAVLARDAVIPFECLSRVDLMDEDLIRTLKDAGCKRIAFGAESGSQKVLDAMRKGTKVDQIRRAVDLCRKYGIESYFFIMLGYPGEKWEDIQMTAALLKETRPDTWSSTVAYPLPGTEFFEEVQHQLLLSDPNWDYTTENKLLFQREYSTRFYRWVQRWMQQEWRLEKARHGELPAPLPRRLRWEAGRLVSRGMVEVLRRQPA